MRRNALETKVAVNGNLLENFYKIKQRNNVSSDKTKLNSVALVRERTVPTERPQLVGELFRIEGVAWSAQRILTVVNLGFLDRSRFIFLQVAPQLS
jgi:hypothetical protein